VPSAPDCLVLGQRVTALNHEALDDAVETSPVVKALVRELFEIFHVAGRHVRPEFKDHHALAGFNHGNFVGVHRFFLLGGGFGFGWFRLGLVGFVGADGAQAEREAERAKN